MSLSADFWKKFYLILIPFSAIVVLRDAFLDFYFLHRAWTFTITFNYNLLVWILWLGMCPIIAWLYFRMNSHSVWKQVFFVCGLALGVSAVHQLVHHWLFNSVLTFMRLAWSALLVSMFLAFLYAIRLQEEKRAAEAHGSRMEKEIEQSRLKHIQTQLDSEQLLGTLREARNRIHDDPDGAEDLLTKLSEELRIALKNIPNRMERTNPQSALRGNSTMSVRTNGLIVLCLTFSIVGIVIATASLLDDLYVWNSELAWTAYWNLWLSWFGVSVLTPFIFWMSRFEPGKKIVFHIGACMLFWCLINGSLQLKDQGLSEWQTIIKSMFANGLAWGFKFDVYGAVLIAAIALNRLEAKRKEDLRLAKMEILMITAQLDALRMQIHPHFLFNSLNSIMELVHQNQKQAAEILVRLEHFLTMTLTTQDVQDVPLSKELDFVSCYLDMQKVRFPKRLSVKMNIDQASMNDRVPVLILQPLVENAVRHGIAQNPGPGEISIQSEKRNGMLQLTIRDTGPGIHSPTIREGIGLLNTKQRLQQTYGNNFRFEMQNEKMGGLLVSLEIPCL